MAGNDESYIKNRPQNLCHMCGCCCRVLTPPKTYEEIKLLEAQGDEKAIDFMKIFTPYPSIEAAREVAPAIVDNIIRRLEEDNKYNKKTITFYKCKYLLDDNKCSIYEERPTLCRHFPITPWSVVPPGCGFEAWLFWKREEDKQKIRKAKEDYIELELLKTKTTNPENLKKIEAVQNKIKHSIELFKDYGSEYW